MKLEINKRRKAEKFTNTWKLKKHTPEQPMDQRRNQNGNKKYLETNKNENTTYQNLRGAAKAVLRGKLQQYKPTTRNKKHLK